MKKVTKRIFEEADKKEEAIRINKYLSEAGVCSRREADSFIEQGKVLIDGEVAVTGSKVLPGQEVSFQGKVLNREEKLVLIAFNKPQGIVCTTDKREPDNIIDYIQYKTRIYPIGRLDKESEGLILLTNNGDIVNKILRAGNNHDKEYIVKVNKPMTPEFLKSMAEGVPILDTVTKPCTIEAEDKLTFRIILNQGLNRQIRRMCEHLGYRVVFLQRIRIMNVNLGRLKIGDYRNLTDRELEGLKELIKDSSNAPMSDEIDDEMVDVRVHEQRIKKPSNNKVNIRTTGKITGKARNKAKNFQKQVSHQKQSNSKSFGEQGSKKESYNGSRKESNNGIKKGKNQRTNPGTRSGR